MRPATCLLPAMFLLIFGPKASGWIDVVSITSLLLILVHFVRYNVRHVPSGLSLRVTCVLGAFTCLFVYALAHVIWNEVTNPFQVLRFGRVLLNAAGCVALVSMYYRLQGPATSDTIMRHLFHCLVFHAGLMLCMFLSPWVRDLIVNRIVQADPDSRTYLAKALGYRIAGLTDSWDALSGLQSLGLIMLPLLLTHQARFSPMYAAVSAPLLIFSVAISGRTGFITAAILFPLAVTFSQWRRAYRMTWMPLALLGCGVILVAGPLRQASEVALRESSLGRTVAIFGWGDTGHETSRESLWDTLAGIVHEHYFLPSDSTLLFFGSGGSGRDSWDYVPADNGPVLNLHNLGIGSTALIYGMSFWMAWSGLAARRINPQAAAMAMLTVCLMVLIDVKVMYLLSRNGFSMMMIPVITSWWEIERHAEKRHHAVPTDLRPQRQVPTQRYRRLPQVATVASLDQSFTTE